MPPRSRPTEPRRSPYAATPKIAAPDMAAPASVASNTAAPYLGVARAAAVALIILVLLAACTQQQPSITLALDASSVELLRGAPETEVLVTLTRSGGAEADVELTLTGLPADVMATFSPAFLSGATHTSTLTLSAPAEAGEGFHALDVTATAAGLEADASLNVQVVGLDVTGVITSPVGPLPGLAVASQDDTAVTDSSGRFTLRGLSVPYDVTAWSTAEKWVHVYEGLTQSEVTLGTNLSPTTPVMRSTSVSGSLSGDAIPVGANQVVMVCAEGIASLSSFCDQVGPTESTFSLSPQWLGSASRSSSLHLLHYESDASGMPIDYLGYATVDLELTDGVPVVFTEPIDMGEPLETIAVELEIDSPDTISTTFGAVQVGPELALSVLNSADDSTSYDVLMPVIPGASYTFVSVAGGLQIGWTAGVTGGEATLVIPEPPTVTAPADGATGVTTDTDFIVSNPTGGPVTWFWSALDYRVALTSLSPTVNLPDTSEYGVPLPSGATVTVELLASGGSTAEVGARAFTDFINTVMFLFTQSSPGLVGQGSLVMGDSQTFTTAP